jgi:hypothetical protein
MCTQEALALEGLVLGMERLGKKWITFALMYTEWERRPTRAKDDRRNFFFVPIFFVDLVRNLF